MLCLVCAGCRSGASSAHAAEHRAPGTEPTRLAQRAPPAPPAAPSPALSGPTLPADPAAEARGERWRGWPMDALLRAMAERPVRARLRRFSRLRPVFQLDLGDGLLVAFKPATTDRPVLWRNDVAGWALARLLGVSDRVPPVASRALPVDLLRPSTEDHLEPWHTPEVVYGSVLFWMPVLSPTPLATQDGQRAWGRWLRASGPALTAEEAVAARDIASLLVLDYLQANTDRWHPDNVRVDEHHRIVFRDNNEGWRDGPMENTAAGAHLLRRAQRFSRALVARLRVADGSALRRAVAPFAVEGEPILREQELARYERRRRYALAYIDRLLRRYGEARVLAFP